MSFYDYGQNDSNGFGDILKGGEQGFTFASGIKSMLQKRKLDAQKAGDEHTQAGITAATDLKSAGLQYAPTPGPTTGGGTVSPLDDPNNQPRSDGAMEVGGTTPLSTGISNPKPTPSMLNRVGSFLAHPFGNGGQMHSDTGQNAGSHTTDQFIDRSGDAGLQLAERDTKRTQDNENARNAATEAGALQRTLATNQTSRDTEHERADAGIREAEIRAAAERGNRMSLSADSAKERELSTLRSYVGNLNSVQHGFMGGLAQAKDSPEWKDTENKKAAALRRMEVLMQMPAHSLDGDTGETPIGAVPQGQGPQANSLSPTPQFFGGGLPPMGDPVWESILRKHGKIK